MKIPRTKSKKITILIYTAAVAAVLAVGSVAYVYAFNGNLFGWTKHKDTPAINLDKPTNEQKQAGSDIKKANADKEDAKGSTGNTDTPAAPAAPSSGSKGNVEVTITANAQNDGLFQLRTLISAVVNTGTCTVTFTKGQQTVTKQAGVQSLPSTSTCKGFDVPVSELSPGQWDVTVTYENDTLSGKATKTVTIQ
jgi:hypothetical protein